MSGPIHRGLALGSSLFALSTAMALLPQQAAAQGFNATGTVFSGNATIIASTPTATQVTVDTPRAIINWVPTDNSGTAPFSFQNANQSVNFNAGSGLGGCLAGGSSGLHVRDSFPDSPLRTAGRQVSSLVKTPGYTDLGRSPQLGSFPSFRQAGNL